MLKRSKKSSRVDDLTGVGGTGSLDTEIDARLKKGQWPGERCALTVIRIVDLVEVNRVYGPEIGDEILRLLVGRIKAAVGTHGSVSREQGTEFAVFFPQASLREVKEWNRDIVATLREPFSINGTQLTIRPAVGAVLGTPQHELAVDILTDARMAAHQAQSLAAGEVVIIDDADENRPRLRADEASIERALAQGDFHLFYQPIVAARTGQIVGFDTLLRWIDAGASGVKVFTPRDFIHQLERSAFAVPVYTWVLEQACRDAQERNLATGGSLVLSVNIAGQQLEEEGFPAMVFAALESSGLPPASLLLDITDEAMERNRELTWERVRSIKTGGVRIGLNDFGGGATSLATLREIAVDSIRIPRLFTSNIESSVDDTVILRHLIALAKEMGIVTIAEGVERASQAERLADLGADLAQGYLYGHPERANEVQQRLRGLSAA